MKKWYVLLIIVLSCGSLYSMDPSEFKKPRLQEKKRAFVKVKEKLLNKWRGDHLQRASNYNPKEKKDVIFTLLKKWKNNHLKIQSEYYDVRQKGDDLKELRDLYVAIIESILNIPIDMGIDTFDTIDITTARNDNDLQKYAVALMQFNNMK